MLALVFTERVFKEKFGQVFINEKEVNSVVDYRFENDYEIAFPEKWKYEENSKDDDYICYCADFKSDDGNIIGSLYVINTNLDVKQFAEMDLKNQSLKYSNLEISHFKYKNMFGILSKYDTTILKGNKFKNTCYYLKMDNKKLLKVIFNVKEDHYNDDVKGVLESIISSINTSK